MANNKDEIKPTETKDLSKKELERAAQTAITFSKAEVLSSLPPDIALALQDFDLRELVGIAPSWKPEKQGEWIAGTVIAEKHGIGKYLGSVLTMESNRGVKSVWLSTDLKLKLGDAPATGRNFVFCYEGKMFKKDNPFLANDMHIMKVIEVLGAKKTK